MLEETAERRALQAALSHTASLIKGDKQGEKDETGTCESVDVRAKNACTSRARAALHSLLPKEETNAHRESGSWSILAWSASGTVAKG